MPDFGWNREEGVLGVSILGLKNPLTCIFNDESGAVTVDWVVLTAGVVVLASVLVQYTGTAILDISDKVADGVANPIPDP